MISLSPQLRVLYSATAPRYRWELFGARPRSAMLPLRDPSRSDCVGRGAEVAERVCLPLFAGLVCLPLFAGLVCLRSPGRCHRWGPRQRRCGGSAAAQPQLGAYIALLTDAFLRARGAPFLPWATEGTGLKCACASVGLGGGV